MRLLVRLLPSLLAFAVLLPALSAAADEVVPDESLRAVLKELAKKKSGKEDLTDAVLGDVFFLEAPKKGIKSLAGLERCVNLALIDLSGNEIADVTPLSGLTNVQSLDLAGNKIKDVGPLKDLKKLQYLKLEKNEVESIAALSELTAMQALYLSDNKVADLGPLSKMEKLASLYLANNQVADLKPIAGLKWIGSLDLKGNQVADVAPLSGLTEQRYTFLQDNKVTDLGPLVEAAKKDAAGDKRFAPYWHLYLTGNPLSEQAKTEQIEALKAAGVRVNPEKK